MERDELLKLVRRIGPPFDQAAEILRRALEAEHCQIHWSGNYAAGSNLADIYRTRVEGAALRGGPPFFALEEVAAAFESRPGVRWQVGSVNGGPYWAAFFVPDDGSSPICLARKPE
jgi:hypothetical protein